ncbi:hypothetical protein BDN72DRAFT_836142 [Pluteus cervinus]|uniref:Uncharacterized protein n=1 Tax=Pluteus cervinus TaxID=181527 RepID=A0ACD3B3B5_9AGAR|nr:hypothetical protein BDN72DRAFT_836142 [Pluteus cervinus]
MSFSDSPDSTSTHKTHHSTSSLLPPFTTTVFTQATGAAVSQSSNTSSSVPVGAIAGGICAGAFLAILLTAAWIYWGRTIDRSAARHQKETEENREQENRRPATLIKPQSIVKSPDTPSTASSLSPSPSPAMPPGLGKAGKKVTFAPKTDEATTPSQPKPGARPLAPAISKAPSREQPVVVDFGINLSAKTTPGPATESTIPGASQGQPLPRISVVNQAELGMALQVPAPSPLRHEISQISHKASTVSSSSVYSTASGEERQSRVPSNLILAALGSLDRGGNTSGEGTRNSTASNASWRLSWSRHGFFKREDSGRSIPEEPGRSVPNQPSQNSLRSVAPSEDENGRVGVAL